jgi:acyl carrier protein
MNDVASTNDQIRRELRDFVQENFLYMHPDVQLDDADNLLELGVIDSLGFVELVEEIQSRYGIVIQDLEINEENFGSISALVGYVESKRTP